MGAMHVAGGIDGAAMLVHFEVYMGAGGAAAGAHQGNRLPLAHEIAGLDQIFLIVGVACHQPIAVGDFHHLAVAAVVPAGKGNYPCGNGYHIGAGLARKVDTVMGSALAGERVRT